MAGYKVKLKNSEEFVLMSAEAYEFIEQNEYYKSLDFFNNLRLHSSGYVFFQRNYLVGERYKSNTLYLHKIIADKFVPKPSSEKRMFVRIINGNALDCRVKNLEWATMSELRRNQKRHQNKTGFRGVVQVGKNSFRAVLYTDSERFDLGIFPTAQEAADAYNKKSVELFGRTKSLNTVKEDNVEQN